MGHDAAMLSLGALCTYNSHRDVKVWDTTGKQCNGMLLDFAVPGRERRQHACEVWLYRTLSEVQPYPAALAATD